MKHWPILPKVVFALSITLGASDLDAVAETAALRAPEPETIAKGPYFGQTPPGEVPTAFAPAFLSAHYSFVARIAFSPDGNECFFTVTDATFSRPQILQTKRQGDAWSRPVVAPFTQSHVKSNEPFFSPDGNRLYFSSDEDGKSPTNRRDIWMVERTPEGWSNLQRLPPPLNSVYTELFFSQSADGIAYFISNRPGGLGGFDLYRSFPEPDQKMRVEHLDAPLNSSADEWDPCIAPDGSFLVFCSTRPGGCGGSDLYISFTDGRGGWTPPVNLGEGFNSAADEYAPSLSPDGRFLFFTRHDGKRGELYWVRTSALERFRTPSKPNAAPNQSAEVTGPYFGQTPPGRTPQIFAPGILSLPNRMEARIVFSPDGDECFFTVPQNFDFSEVQMYYTKRVDNIWSPQVLAPVSLPGTFCGQPFFSADGHKLYFTSNKNGSTDIWVAERTAQGWSTPRILPPPVNSTASDGPYSETADGATYIDSLRPGGKGNGDIWVIRPPRPDQPAQAENLGAAINSSANEGDPLVSPDESYLIFTSDRAGGSGGLDLYVAKADGHGGWNAPENLNKYCPGINTEAFEYGPSLSPDGRYLFFVRLDPKEKQCDVWWVANPFAPKLVK